MVLYGTPIETGLLALAHEKCGSEDDDFDDFDDFDDDVDGRARTLQASVRDDAISEGDLETLDELHFLLLAKPKRANIADSYKRLDAASVCSNTTSAELPTRAKRRQTIYATWRYSRRESCAPRPPPRTVMYRRPCREATATTPRAFGYVLDVTEHIMLLRVNRTGVLSGPCIVLRHAQRGALSHDLETTNACAPRSFLLY